LSALSKHSTYYELLGVTPKSNEREIKKAFRGLAKKYHPDINPAEDAANMFRMVHEAYEILSDPYRRQIYDYLLARQEIVRKYKKEQREQNSYKENEQEFERYKRQARQKARAHAKMKYAEFEKSLYSQFIFHFQQSIGVVINTILYAVGLVSAYFGLDFIIEYPFNGALVAGYLCIGLSLASLYGAWQMSRNILQIWQRWFKWRMKWDAQE